jgi:hypothetical protein
MNTGLVFENCEFSASLLLIDGGRQNLSLQGFAENSCEYVLPCRFLTLCG